MLDRSLLCAPLLVPTFLSIVLWPKEPVGRSIHVAAPAPVEAAAPAGLATAGIPAAAAGAPLPERPGPVERGHGGCADRKANPAAATRAT